MIPCDESLSPSSIRRSLIASSLRSGRFVLLLIMLVALGGAFVCGIAPLVLGQSLDGILSDGRSMTVTFSGVRLLLLVGLGAVCVQLANQVLQKVFSRSFIDQWMPVVFRKISECDLRALECHEAGYLNRRMSAELKAVPGLFSIEIPGLLESALVMAFSLIMLVHLLPGVALVLVGAGTILVPLGVLVSRRMRALVAQVMERWSLLEGFTTDIVSSQVQVRAFGAEERVCDRAESLIRQTTHLDLRNSIRSMLLLFLMFLVLLGGMTGFLVYAEKSPSMATANLGTVVSFLGYLWVFAGRLTGTATAVGRIQSSLASLDRMVQMLVLPRRAIEPGTTVSPRAETLEARRLGFDLDGKTLFDGVSFSIGRGDILAIRGRSGCGKTTLLRSMYGLYPLSRGELLLDGERIDGLMAIGRDAVYLPQEARLWKGSLRSNLEILAGRGVTTEELDHLIERLDLSARFSSRAEGQMDVSGGGGNLSGGERQRLVLGALMLRRPLVALLDEPTSQLDMVTEELILRAVRELAEAGSIVLVVAHRPAVEAVSTRILDLDSVGSSSMARCLGVR
ncbi:ABC transporter ATP-binding protein [Candidatus Fermentibacterales bacterium]|nr:ABC transporter ATP-binding protein [Candidatus Fermentibacterales bacterium]